MVATSADTVMCLRSAISRKPSQNWSSSDTLDLCPLRIIERLITGELAARCAGLRSVTGVSEDTTVFDIFLDPDASARTIKSGLGIDRKSTRLNSSHMSISYAVFCLKK